MLVESVVGRPDRLDPAASASACAARVRASKALLAALGLQAATDGARRSQPRTIVVSLVLGIGVTVAAAWAARAAGVAASPRSRRCARAVDAERLDPASGDRRRDRDRDPGIAAIGRALFGGASNPGAPGWARRRAHVPRCRDAVAAVRARPRGRDRPSVPAARHAGRLGGENAKRNPRRTASTASALMIGLGLVAFVSVFAASLKASAVEDARRGAARRSDAVVEPVQLRSRRSSPKELAPTIRTSPPCRRSARAEAKVGSSDDIPDRRSTRRRSRRSRISTWVSGSLADLVATRTRCSCRGPRPTARGLSIGSHGRHDVRARPGTQQLHVVGTFENNAILNDYVVSLDTYDANVEQALDQTCSSRSRTASRSTDAKTRARRDAAEGLPERAGQRPGGVEAAVPRFGEPVACVRVRPAVPVDHHLRRSASWTRCGCRSSSGSGSSGCSARWA